MATRRITRIGTGLAGLALAGALLGACGSSAHVVGPAPTSPPTVATTPTTAPAVTTPGSGGTATPGAGTLPGGGLSSQGVTQIDDELSQLSSSLGEAENDIDNPNQGDQ